MKRFCFILFSALFLTMLSSCVKDNTNIPFINDEEIFGTIWTPVDFVKDIDDFSPAQIICNKNKPFFIKRIIFEPNGKVTYEYKNGVSINRWSKGFIINDTHQTVSTYTAKQIEGKKYLFVQWKPFFDYQLLRGLPSYYVLVERSDK
ncbi:MAG: hypothetical protein NTY22_04010 [Proteobacteria bacterium]|nr:hypothetical protein [Pseudomonadota bacterium]